MAQFVFMIQYPLNNEAVAVPYDVNIYTTDQVIVWKNLVPGTQWSTKHTPPIVVSQEWLDAGGSVASRATAPDGAPLWTAAGPGAPKPGAPSWFTYEAYIELIDANGETGAEVRIAKRKVTTEDEEIFIDPDIWNQPQP